MNAYDSGFSDEIYSKGTISTAGATVHSDDFQIYQPMLQHPDDTFSKATRIQKTVLKSVVGEERNEETTEVALDNDSRVPSVSSRASILSTSSCKTSTAELDEQTKSQKSMSSTERGDEEEISPQQQAKRKALWKRRQREAARVAWERRSFDDRDSDSSCPSPPQAIHQGGDRYGGSRARSDDAYRRI